MATSSLQQPRPTRLHTKCDPMPFAFAKWQLLPTNMNKNVVCEQKINLFPEICSETRILMQNVHNQTVSSKNCKKHKKLAKYGAEALQKRRFHQKTAFLTKKRIFVAKNVKK